MEEIITKLEEAEYETGGDLVVWLRRQLGNLEYAAIQERLATELGEKNPAGWPIGGT
jgi:RNase P protein component